MTDAIDNLIDDLEAMVAKKKQEVAEIQVEAIEPERKGPAWSGAGNLRNMEKMKPQKLVGIYQEYAKDQDLMDDDGKGWIAVKREVERRIHLDTDDGLEVAELLLRG